MARASSIVSNLHPYLKDYSIKKFGLFRYINNSPGPSKPLMTPSEWEEFCKHKAIEKEEILNELNK